VVVSAAQPDDLDRAAAHHNQRCVPLALRGGGMGACVGVGQGACGKLGSGTWAAAQAVGAGSGE
jgi:hypothetical protein